MGALEHTVRALVAAGARFVVFGYTARLGTEHTFLDRMSDLGDVHVDVFTGWSNGRCGISALAVHSAVSYDARGGNGDGTPAAC